MGLRAALRVQVPNRDGVVRIQRDELIRGQERHAATGKREQFVTLRQAVEVAPFPIAEVAIGIQPSESGPGLSLVPSQEPARTAQIVVLEGEPDQKHVGGIQVRLRRASLISLAGGIGIGAAPLRKDSRDPGEPDNRNSRREGRNRRLASCPLASPAAMA